MDTKVADPLLGSLVDGRYRIHGRVARGGMATVYTADDERLDRTVAVKIVHPAQASQPHFVDRFIDEAKTVARLTHPGVVAVYDQGTHDGLPYLVMEYVRGGTLREVLAARQRLTPVEALAILEQMLAGIAAAHRAGLVHRDIKPENVLVAESPSGGAADLVDCVVKVTDFGLARAVEASAEDNGDGQLLATVAYVPPELVAEGRVHPPGDVYSAGVMLFEMLTGRVPYDGDDAAEVAWWHVDHEVPPPSRYVDGLPPVLDDLVARTTRRDPRGRPADAGEFLSQVQTAREELILAAAHQGEGGTMLRPRPADGPPAAHPRHAADATVVMSAMPDPDRPAGAMSAMPDPDRPAWARLPSTRARPESRRPGTVVTGGRRLGGGDPPGGARGLQIWQRGLPGGRPERAVVVAAVVIFGLLVVVGGWWFGIGRYVPAPDLRNLSKAEAVARANDEGLAVSFAEPRYSQEVEADRVLTQDPGPAGRVRRGGEVVLTLSLGPERFPVLDVKGIEYDVAVRQLEALGLTVRRGPDGFSDTVPEGRVMATDPDIDTEVGPGDTVTVSVSRGRAPISVPLLIGENVNQAQAELQQLGLVPAVEYVEDSKPRDEVIAQDPTYDSGVEQGATVTLKVSEGPPAVPVPDVAGRDCRDARAILEQSGFRIRAFGNRGEVRLQNPGANVPLEPGSEITIWCI